jgi:RHS repeat-associated protein
MTCRTSVRRLAAAITVLTTTLAVTLVSTLTPAPAQAHTSRPAAGVGQDARPLPAAAQPNHGLPAGERPPVVPPTIATDQPAQKVDSFPGRATLGPDEPVAKDLVLRPGFAIGDSSLAVYFDIGTGGPDTWQSWRATAFDPEQGTAQPSDTLSPDQLARCGFPRTFCHTLGASAGWQLVPGHKYFVTITATLRTGGDLESDPSEQAAAREVAVPPAVPTPQAVACGCPTALAYTVALQAIRGTGVRTGTGAFQWSAQDLKLSSFAVPFVATRYYSSANTVSGMLGRGWAWSYDVRVLPPADDGGVVIVRAEDGAQVPYSRNDDGSYARPPGVRSALARTGDGWLLTTPAQIRYTFAADGRLLSIKNTKGFGVSLAYREGLIEITDAAGRVVQASLKADGLVASVRLPDGRAVHYGYTAGQLTSVIDAAGAEWKYVYADGLLAQVIDPRGIVQIANDYNGSRVVAQRDANGARTTFGWRPDIQEAKTIDPDGVTIFDGYRDNVLVYSQNANGDVDNLRYDQALNATLSVDPKANQYERAFDATGNQLSALAPQPFSFTESRAYDAANNLVAFTDGNGNQGAYFYNASNELEKARDPNGDDTQYRYDERGLLIEETDALGRVTHFGYDADGNQIAKTAPTGAVTRFGYDSSGRMISRTDPRGFVTTYGFDALDRVVSIQSPGKRNPATKQFDVAGQLVATTDPLGRTTKYFFDKVIGRQVRVVEPGDRTTAFGYTKAGRRASVTDPDGNIKTYAYDARGLLATAVSPRGNEPGADKAAFTTTFVYDMNGNLLRTTRPYPGGGVVEVDSAFDELDRVHTVTDPLGKSSTVTLDNANNILTSVDPLGAETRIRYDANGRPTAVTRPGGATLETTVDKVGNVIRRVSPVGGVTAYTYDGENRPLTMTDALGHVTKYRYDLSGNLVEVTDPLGHKQSFSYDENDRVLSSTDQNGAESDFTYDDGDQLIQVEAPDAGRVRYDYNDDGTIATRVDREGHHYRYDYDKLLQLTAVTDPNQTTRRFAYDAERNLVGIITAGTGDEAARTITDTYDPLNRRVRRTLGTDGPVYEYGFDAANRLVGVTDPAGSETMTYDDRDRLTSVTRDGRAFRYAYDEAGNVNVQDRPDGSRLESLFDKQNRLTRLTVAGSTYQFEYDLNNRLTKTVYPDATGLVTHRVYDDAGRTAEISTQAASGESLARYQMQRDAVGNPTLITITRGDAVERTAYVYDKANRVLAACYGVSNPTAIPDACPDGAAGSVSYSYDSVGNRLGERTAGSMGESTTNYTYTPRDELHQANIHGEDGHVLRKFGYDDEGNLIADGDSTFTYNLDHTVASATVDGKTTRFGYDARGMRISATDAESGATRQWQWDINGKFPQLAVEDSSSGSRDFVHSPVNGALAMVSGGDSGEVDSYVPDWLGGVSDVVSPTGGVLEQHDYDPYGNVRTNGTAGADTGTNPLRFNAMYDDPTLGGRYALPLRAYDPTTGRFDGLDPVPSSIREPVTSSYAYVLDRPTVLLDVTGGRPIPDGGGSSEPVEPDPSIPSPQAWDKYPWELPCTVSPAQYCQILMYIYGEIKRNSHSDKVRMIKGQMDYFNDPPWWSFLGQSPGDALESALTMWAVTVCQGCEWDHKPKIRERFHMTLENLDTLYSPVPATRYRIFYDVWSNIHYGYVGVQAGFDDQTLQQGPSMGLPGTGTNDQGDVISTQIGIDLSHRIRPDDLRPDDIDYAIRAKLDDYYTAKDSKTVILRK